MKCIIMILSKSMFVVATLMIGMAVVDTAAAATLSTTTLVANSLTFTCTTLLTSNYTNDEASTTTTMTHNVILLHGFPFNRLWFDPVLAAWEDDESLSVHAIACDLRGYSLGASPNDVDDYEYGNLVSDVFALADAAGFAQFHLVGHDHGAGIGWLASSLSSSSSSSTRQQQGSSISTGRILSYTSMGVPHIDLFSAALCGDEEIQEQVVASNYFNQFALPDSATINDGALTALLASFGVANESDPVGLQKKLWWYHGAFEYSGGYWSLPRVVDDSEVPDELAVVNLVRQAIPMDERPCVPKQQPPMNAITSFPVLLVCGAQDPYLLCTRPEYTPTSDVISYYTYYEAPSCGHDFFLEQDCDNATDGDNVIAAITEFIVSAPTRTSIPTSGAGASKRTSTAAATVVVVLLVVPTLLLHAATFLP